MIAPGAPALGSVRREITLTFAPRLPWQRRLVEAVQSPARFIVAVMGRRAGKTSAVSRIAGETALRKGMVFWGAPTYDIAMIGREKFLSMYRGVLARPSTISPPNADVLGGGRVIWRSFDRSGGALGHGIDLAIVDEAARVKRQILYEELLPTIGDTGGKIVATTTPRGRRSWVFDWYQRALAGDPLYAVVHGPSTENPSAEILEFVEVARANMPDALFRQEIMAEFVEGEGTVFRRIMENATLGGWLDGPREGATYVVGTDLAKHQDYTVCVALEVETGEVHGFERYRRLDWPLIKDRIREFAKKWNGLIWLDATGIGDPVFDDLLASGVPVSPIKFTNQSKSALVVALSNAMEKGEVKYADDPVLISELESFAYDQLPSGKFRYSAPEGGHDDCVMALALAVWGRTRRSSLADYGWV